MLTQETFFHRIFMTVCNKHTVVVLKIIHVLAWIQVYRGTVTLPLIQNPQSSKSAVTSGCKSRYYEDICMVLLNTGDKRGGQAHWKYRKVPVSLHVYIRENVAVI